MMSGQTLSTLRNLQGHTPRELPTTDWLLAARWLLAAKFFLLHL